MSTSRTWLGFVGFAIIAAAVALNSAWAADYTWDGATDIWSSPHWNPGSVAGPTAAGNTATIGSGTVNFSQHDTFGNAETLDSPDITLNTGGILSNNGGVGNWFNTIWNLNLNGGTLYANGGHTLWGAFGLAGTVTVGGVDASTISGNGTANARVDVRNSGTTFDVSDVTGNPDADLVVSAILANGNSPTWNAGYLIKSGSGTMRLSGANTYTGWTMASGGILDIASGGSVIGSSALNTRDGGTNTVSGTVTLATISSFGVGAGVAGTTGTVIVNPGGVLNIGGTRGFTGIGGKDATGGGLGNGTLTIAGGTVNVGAPGANNGGLGNLDATKFWMNPYGTGGGVSTINLDGGTLSTAREIRDGSGGSTRVNFNGGTIEVTAATAGALFFNIDRVDFRDGGGTIDTKGFNITYNQVLYHSNIPGDNAIDGGLTKAGSGTLTLGGVNTFTGDTLINDGQVKLGNALALQYSAYDTTGSTGPIGLDITGFTTPTLGGLAGDVDAATAITGYGAVSALTLNPQAGSSVTYSGVISDGVAGMAVTKTGGGTQSLAGVNTFTGPMICTGGTLDIASGGSVSNIFRLNTKTGGEITISGTVTLADNASFGVGAGIQGTTGSLTVNPGGELNIGAAGAFTGIGGGDVFAQRTQSGNGTLTVAGGVLNVAAPGTASSGAGGLDASRFWLNPYGSGGGTSTINLDGGTLSTARPIQHGSGGGALAVFNFNGGTLEAAEATALSLLIGLTRVNVRDGGGTIDTRALTITYDQTLLHSDIGGDNAVDGGLTKAGSGTLSLGGLNTFTGDLTIDDGTLIDTVQANNANPAATGLGNMTTAGRTITVNSAGTLVFAASDAMGSYQYKPPVMIAADGGTIINGNSRFMSIGDISLMNGGRLVTTNGANVLFQAFNLRGSITVSGTSGSFITATGTDKNGVHLGGTTTAATTFDVGATGDPTADLMVTAPLLDEVYAVGSLIKTGAGRMVLGAVCTYTGSTTIDDGTLAFGGNNVLDADNDIVLAGGALDMGPFDAILGTLEVTSASTIVLGSGMLRFDDSDTIPWTGNLALVGTLGPTSVRFGNNGNALTASQVQRISIDGSPVDIAADGYLTRASQGTLFIVQ